MRRRPRLPRRPPPRHSPPSCDRCCRRTCRSYFVPVRTPRRLARRSSTADAVRRGRDPLGDAKRGSTRASPWRSDAAHRGGRGRRLGPRGGHIGGRGRPRGLPGSGGRLRRAAARREQAEKLRRLAKGLRRVALPHTEARPPDLSSPQGLSRPGETEGTSGRRLQHAGARAARRHPRAAPPKYAPKKAALEERLRRADQAGGADPSRSRARAPTAISVGTTLLGAFLGRSGGLPRPSAAPPLRHAARDASSRSDRTWAAPRRPSRRFSSNSPIWIGLQGRRGEARPSGDASAEPLEAVSVRLVQAERDREAGRARVGSLGQDGAGQSTPAWQ